MTQPTGPDRDNRVRIKPEAREKGARAVRPRDAASLVILRRGGGDLEVLMGQRPKKSRFMPDAYVFPGGRVDAADARANPATPLPADVAAHLERGATAARARALAMAAVRETFEETGLMLGEPGHVGGVRHETWSALRTQGVAPNLAPLDYIARAITRAESPVRFDARFFVVDAGHLTGDLTGSGELLDLQWIPIDKAREMPTAVITQFILSEVTRLDDAPPEQRRKRAYYRWRGNRRAVDYI